MKFVRVSKTTLVNPHRISYVEQTEKRIVVGIDGRVIAIESKDDLDLFLKELEEIGNPLFGRQHFGG